MIRELGLATAFISAFALSAAATEPASAPIDMPTTVVDSIVLTEVVSFQRNADNMVIGLHADIGGSHGMGQTRVGVTTSQFKLQDDRVVLGLTAAQAKVLLKITM